MFHSLVDYNAINLSDLMVETLCKYWLTKIWFEETANTLSTNSSIGRVTGLSPDVDFDYTTELNGCLAHVINLSVKEGLNIFG